MNEGIPSTALALSDVHFEHENGHKVLDGVNFSVAPSDKTAILGPNGSGKSTLLKILAAAWKPTHGQLLMNAEPMNYRRKGRDELRKRVQMVLQEPDEQLFATTVYADVSYGPVNLGLGELDVEKRVSEALAATGIADLADRVPHQLSYGQRKQVAIAGALAMHPDILLLDEPTAGLDPAATSELLALLDRLHEQGVAIVLSTHDVDFAWVFAETAGLLVDGHLTTGPASQLLSDRQAIQRARLQLPWAAAVSRALGRDIRRPEDI